MRMRLSLPHSFCPHSLPPCSFLFSARLVFRSGERVSSCSLCVSEWEATSDQQKTEYGAQEAWQNVKEKHVSRKTGGEVSIVSSFLCHCESVWGECEARRPFQDLRKGKYCYFLFTKYLSRFSTVLQQFGSGYRMPFIVEFASVDYIIDIHSVFKSLSFWITLQTFSVKIYSGTCFKIHLLNYQSHLSKHSK